MKSGGSALWRSSHLRQICCADSSEVSVTNQFIYTFCEKQFEVFASRSWGCLFVHNYVMLFFEVICIAGASESELLT